MAVSLAQARFEEEKLASPDRPIASSRPHIEFYQGYKPYHERYYVGTKDGISHARDRKYTDVQLNPVKLSDQALFKSTNQFTYTPDGLAQKADLPVLRGYRAIPNPEYRGHRSARDFRDANESAGAPTVNWQTLYRDNYHGWETFDTYNQASAATQARYHFRLNAEDYHKKHHADLLQREPLVSSHQVDFANPYYRRVQPRGQAAASPGLTVEHHNVLSHTGTTSDLFGGTSKGTIRIPGYRGHIPSSSHNRHRLAQPVIEPGVKNILADTYALDLPGYTGHQPRSRLSVHETRRADNMAPPPVGPQTTLLLDGMRANMV
jgi:hypothetical protein